MVFMDHSKAGWMERLQLGTQTWSNNHAAWITAVFIHAARLVASKPFVSTLIYVHTVALPGEGHYPVTVSIGIAAMRHSISQIKALLSEADQALYHAKNRGRNRVSLFEPDEPLPTTVKPE